MFRKDNYGRFVKSGFSVFTTYRFNTGKLYTKDSLCKSEYENILEYQETEPYNVMHESSIYSRWWMYQGEFYIVDDHLSQDDVKALILYEPIKREKRKIYLGLGKIIPFVKRKEKI